MEMDEYIQDRLSDLTSEEKEFYLGKIQSQIEQLLKTDKTQMEINGIKKEIEKLERAIKSHMKTLRSATSAARPYIEADINDIAAEIADKRKLLSRMEETASDTEHHIQNLEQIKKTIISLNELMEKAEPSEVISLINSVVERIYIVRNGKEQVCHLFIKGCPEESYDDFFAHSDTPESQGDESIILCDSGECRKLHPYVCRNSAARRVQSADESAARQIRPGL